MIDEIRIRYRRQWLLTSGILALLGFAVAYDVYEDRRRTEAGEYDRLLTQARVINENLSRQLVATYNALDRILRDLPPPQSAAFSPRTANALLSAIEEAMPGIRTLLIIDARGVVRASNRPKHIGMNLSARQEFLAVKQRPDPSILFLSPPLTTPLGVFTMDLSRMISGTGGRFDGVMVATVDPEYCRTLLASVQYAPDMWSAMAHGNGIQFLMVPDRPGQPGMNLAKPGSFFTRHRASGRDESIMTGAVYATGEERVMALRTVRPAAAHLSAPLVVAVGRDLHALYAGWRRNAATYSGIYLVVVAVTALSVRYNQANVLRASEQARRSKEALEASERRYRLLAENTTDVVWQLDLRANRFIYVSPSVRQLRGYTPEEVMALPAEASVTPASWTKVREWMTQAFAEFAAGRTSPLQELREVEQPRKDGTTVWTEVAATYILDAEHRPAGIIGISRDISERKRAERLLRLALDEKETLLKEIHHRVKNNMQVVSSLLYLQSQKIDDPAFRAMFQESQQRVKSMALVHEKLYQSKSLAEIDFREYIALLVRELSSFYDTAGRGITTATDVAAAALDVERAVPCALIINELLTNAYKYAFPGRTGEVRVAFRQEEDGAYGLTIRDSGVGLPERLDLRAPTSLGFQLVTVLTKQLHGDLEISTGGGTTVHLSFPSKGARHGES